jgi:hypothetical protein
MLTCPLCKKDLTEPVRACPQCRADLSLLADLMTDVRKLLDRADSLRKAGELAPAVQAYFDVLDADPTNAEARAAVGPVLRSLRVAGRIGAAPPAGSSSLHAGLIVGAAVAALALGYLCYFAARTII